MINNSDSRLQGKNGFLPPQAPLPETIGGEQRWILVGSTLISPEAKLVFDAMVNATMEQIAEIPSPTGGPASPGEINVMRQIKRVIDQIRMLPVEDLQLLVVAQVLYPEQTRQVYGWQ